MKGVKTKIEKVPLFQQRGRERDRDTKPYDLMELYGVSVRIDRHEMGDCLDERHVVVWTSLFCLLNLASGLLSTMMSVC